MTNNSSPITRNDNSLFCHPALDAGSRNSTGFRRGGRKDKRKSFTLIELLVVLALVAILSVVVILTLNPAELIKQARDSNRLSDLSTINTALNLFSTDVTSGFMGTSTVVYVSIPSASPTCSGVGLPTLPTGYTYNCATAQNLRNTDGTGWIPVNFQRISSNSPISQLPIDPINTTSTRLYYTYVSGGSWELNASIEAAKNKLGGSGDVVSKDGGSSPSQYEIGNNLNLNPVETGDSSLVGYWKFDETTGTTAYDASGVGNTGTDSGSVSITFGKSGNARIYNGGYTGIPLSSSLAITTPMTIATWVNYANQDCDNAQILGTTYGPLLGYSLWHCGNILGSFMSSSAMVNTQTIALNIGVWYHIAISWDGSYIHIYQNGIESGPAVAFSGLVASDRGLHIGSGTGGLVDEARVYNRALSAAEILALYNATK